MTEKYITEEPDYASGCEGPLVSLVENTSQPYMPLGVVSERTLDGSINLWIIEYSPSGELRRQKVAFDEIPIVDETSE